jgi:hypothetical protein
MGRHFSSPFWNEWMVQFNDWCDAADTPLGNHHVRVMTGRTADAAMGIQLTATAVPAHYAAEERLAAALARLGKPAAAKMVTDLLPQTPQIRSGDLGEIYATEWIDAHSGYRAPIKRLRWKDHRDMAMRGDDVIGMILILRRSAYGSSRPRQRAASICGRRRFRKRALGSTRMAAFRRRTPCRSSRRG